MPNPVVHAIPVDTWVAVAETVQQGFVWVLLDPSTRYVQTYRLAGDPAPMDMTDAAPFPAGEPGLPVRALVDIDVYVRCINTAGSVRADF